MSDLRTEGDLRAALTQLSEGAPTVEDVLPDAGSRYPRRRPVGRAPLAAAVLVVAVAIGVTVGIAELSHPASRPASPSVSRTGQDPSLLIGTSWKLTSLHDLSGTVAPVPAGQSELLFNGADAVSDGQGDAVAVQLQRGSMTFSSWVNDVVTVSGRQLRGAQLDFLFKLLNGTVQWTVTDGLLTVTHPGVGAATYRADAATTGLTQQQRALAIQIARSEASGSNPDHPGIIRPITRWPAYVDSVAATVLPYQQAVAQLDGNGSAHVGQALVVRLTGRFASITTGPPGSGTATGNVITAVVPLETGEVTDSGITNELHPKPLPQQTLIYRR